ncbi:MAG: DUF3365 domain-containing protein [Gammaproteobacteria bacterium]|nr:DUF3365 domain-containing protein [Gammaproteobacteria bacterium]
MTRLLFIVITFMLSPAFADNQQKELAGKSKAAVQEFMGQLKGELQTSMKSGGPIKAVEVCKEKAPLIAKNLSEKYGWKIARTSLKTRNSNNAPDAWETKVLHDFEKRKQNGEQVKPMAYFETVNENGVKSFRFMKAIPTGKACLSCHGDNLDAALTAKLDSNYPNDKARGFKVGDIRGAFTITQPLN